MSTRPAKLMTARFGLILVMQTCFSFAWSMFMLLPKYVAVELGGSSTDIGLLSFASGCVAVAAVPLVGRLIDRMGRKPLISLGCLAATVHAFAFTQVQAVDSYLFLLQLLYGLCFVFTFNGAATLVADQAPPERLGEALALFGASMVVMNAGATASGELIAEAAGWDAAFLTAGAVGLVSLVLSRFVHEAPRTPEAAHSQAPVEPAVRTRIRADALIMAACGAAFASIFTYHQPFALSLGITEVRRFFIGFSLVVLFARLFMGSLMDRIGRARVAAITMGLYVVVLACMPTLRPGGLFYFGAAFGLAHGLFYPAMNTLAVAGVPERVRGRAMTAVNGGFQGGYTVSVLGLGLLADSAGYAAVFLCGSALACGGLVLVLRRPPEAMAYRAA